ncbi:hypothetical protein OIE48_00390 [Streptosporangium sp. NBC_01756]|nr:hypothetical protein OIE48_00390 [Streptosporangium sp. NBC_01756]
MRQIAARSGEDFGPVVDQFEEVFTLCGDDVERDSFIEALVTAASAALRRTPFWRWRHVTRPPAGHRLRRQDSSDPPETALALGPDHAGAGTTFDMDHGFTHQADMGPPPTIV